MKHFDLHTFGKTPACVYLAYQLAQINDPRLANRVGQSLTHFRDLLRSLERSNNVGVMSHQQACSFAARLRHTADQQHEKFSKKSEIVANLVRNIMIGELKSFQRRGSQVKYSYKSLQRDLSDVPGTQMSALIRELRPKLNDFTDEISPETLMKKSLEKLERKGKISTLY